MNFKPITITICQAIAEELMPLYEENKALRSSLGFCEKTFEEWYEDMLTIGCLHTIKRNARFINDANKLYLGKNCT